MKETQAQYKAPIFQYLGTRDPLERGPESVRDIATYYAGHDLNHFAQIEAILAQVESRDAARVARAT